MTPPKFAIQVLAKAAFSLVEVVLALGICSFAMIAIIGMIPVGLSTFKGAMETTAQTQIVQSLAGEVLLTNYKTLTDPATGQSAPTYYNDQGIPTSVADSIYTAVIERQRLEAPADFSDNSPTDLSDDPGVTLLIKITRNTHPNQVFTYPVIVANTNG